MYIIEIHNLDGEINTLLTNLNKDFLSETKNYDLFLNLKEKLNTLRGLLFSNIYPEHELMEIKKEILSIIEIYNTKDIFKLEVKETINGLENRSERAIMKISKYHKNLEFSENLYKKVKVIVDLILKIKNNKSHIVSQYLAKEEFPILFFLISDKKLNILNNSLYENDDIDFLNILIGSEGVYLQSLSIEKSTFLNKNYDLIDFFKRFKNLQMQQNEFYDFMSETANSYGKDKFNNEIIQKKYENKIKEISKSQNDYNDLFECQKEKLQEIEEYSEKIKNVSSIKVYTDLYQSEKSTADVFRGINLIILFFIGAISILIGFNLISNIMLETPLPKSIYDSSTILVKLTFLLPLGIIAFYLNKESVRHRNIANQAKQTESELIALSHYTLGLSGEQIGMLRLKLADRYFGIRLNQVNDGDTNLALLREIRDELNRNSQIVIAASTTLGAVNTLPSNTQNNNSKG